MMILTQTLLYYNFRRYWMVQRDITKQPPIGYWLKHTDEVITKHVNQVLCDNGFTRFRWQVLNVLYEAGTTTKSDIFTTMKTFIDAHKLDEILDGFDQEGWLMKSSEVRRRALQGIIDQEYMIVIDVLQRIVNNLE
jgi:hypothetical protein